MPGLTFRLRTTEGDGGYGLTILFVLVIGSTAADLCASGCGVDFALVLTLAAAYLVGSIPVGPWLGRLAGVDVQRHGSGNTGATNVARTVGRLAGIATLLGDALKGVAAVLTARLLVQDDWIAVAAGLAAVLGHSFSIFLGFGGGKGVATAFGMFVVLAPAAAAACAGVFVVVAFASKYASLASITAALTLPVATYLGHYPNIISYAAIAAAAFVVVRHRDNLRRLADGSEPKFRSKS